LPIGVQIMGKHFDEATILRVGSAVEAAQQD
jgi:aspartyl-tRNA(Asn)/glutamyl-tRNA(Gln) amidotransferase subunit A